MPSPLTATGFTLDTGLENISGVGPRQAFLLAARGLTRVEDLLSYLPFRYEDRSRICRIQELRPGESATVMAQVRSFRLLRTRGGMQIGRLRAADDSGELECVWYHAAWLRDRFQTGQWLALYGKPEPEGLFWRMNQPEFQLLHHPPDSVPDSLKLGRIVPIYESLGELSSGRLRLAIARALRALPPSLPEILPAPFIERLHLPTRRAAFEQVHFPAAGVSLELLQAARTPGHLRLILEELFFLQTGLEIKRQRALRQPGIPLLPSPEIRERLRRLLPFRPTADQKQAMREIVADLGGGRPMRRLLQGDVGSGKTIVALQAAVMAIGNGYQAALMAPTQILAEQHFMNAHRLLPGYRLALVTSAARRSRSAPEPELVIGTQALLENRARLRRLALVIVDEQHRFGVLQRLQLMRQGEQTPHVLVMTATPIPRTLALAFYGDLDTSLLRLRPPGRLPIRTRIVPRGREAEMYEFVRRQLAAGRQTYVVCPVIEESEKLDLVPALDMERRLRALYPEFQIGLLHGRLASEEKSAVMQAFQRGKLHLLVSTTVIEVGVDVPNATVMVIHQAERFGIAQLHQLRGRVGRPQPRSSGARRAFCFLVPGEEITPAARQRLAVVEASEDGFELAEMDLKLRGPGEFFGTRQSGLPEFAIAQPLRDQELLEVAHSEARAWWRQAGQEEKRRLLEIVRARWQRNYGLVEVG